MNNDIDAIAVNSLEILLSALKTDVINSMQAAGKTPGAQTIGEMTISRTVNGAQLQLPGFFSILETGRRPTGRDAPGGDPPMIYRIKTWCQQKGIPDKQAWAIKKAIDKNGFKGSPGLFSEPLSEVNIDLRLNPVIDQIAAAISEQITGTFKHPSQLAITRNNN